MLYKIDNDRYEVGSLEKYFLNHNQNSVDILK